VEKSKTEMFKEKYRGYFSERTMKEYTAIIRLIEENRLRVRSKSRHDQVKAVLSRCNEIGIELEYNLPKWSKREDSKLKKTQEKVITQEQLEAIIKNLPQTDKGDELVLAVELSYVSGMRLSEVLSLKPGDINFDGGLKATITGKGKKSRTIFFPVDFRERLEKFSGFTITAGYVESTFRRAVRKAGVMTSFHGLRHSFATNMLRGGVKINKVQKLLGHSNIATTSIYLHCIEDVDEDMKALGY